MWCDDLETYYTLQCGDYEVEPVVLAVQVEATSEKAVLLTRNGYTLWFPKTQLTWVTDASASETKTLIQFSGWIQTMKGEQHTFFMSEERYESLLKLSIELKQARKQRESEKNEF